MVSAAVGCNEFRYMLGLRSVAWLPPACVRAVWNKSSLGLVVWEVEGILYALICSFLREDDGIIVATSYSPFSICPGLFHATFIV